VIANSTITCPVCGTAKTQTMPTDARQYFYECIDCGELLRPKPGGLLRVLLLRIGALPADTGG
jgi:hypothetical protein